MPNFVFAYHGDMPKTPTEGAKMKAAWTAWFKTLGDAVVDGGAPIEKSKTVRPSGIMDDGGSNPLSGYSVVKAGNIEAACEMAKSCPIVIDGSGSVEVAQVHEM